MSTYDDMNRKVQQDSANGRTGMDTDAMRRMSSQQREAYETSYKNQNKQ